MRNLAMIIVCGGLIAAYGIGGVQAGDAEDTLCIPMGSILIEPPAGVDAKRSPVEFPHSTHFDYTCKTCHHTWDGEEPVLSCTTAGCHDLASSRTADGKVDPALDVRNYKTAFHGSCLVCHKEIKLKNRQLENSYSMTAPMLNSGPTSCNSCHPKE